MIARHRAPAPDGRFAGIALLSANLIGFTTLAGATYGAGMPHQVPPTPATAPDQPPAPHHGPAQALGGTH